MHLESNTPSITITIISSLTLSLTAHNLGITDTHPVALSLCRRALALLVECVISHAGFASETHVCGVTCKAVVVAGSAVQEGGHCVGQLIMAWGIG